MLTSATDINSKKYKNIDFYICKNYFKRNMNKKAVIISKQVDNVIARAKKTLSENGYYVTIYHSKEKALAAKESRHITFLDCRKKYSLLKEVEISKYTSPLLIAIVDEEFSDKKNF